MTDLNVLKTLWKQHSDQALDDFMTLLKFQSVSSEAKYHDDVVGCANWLVAYLKEMGFDSEIWETPGHPVVFASHLQAGGDKPTLLIYNHYDVQPVDPIELWESAPFIPDIRDGEVYARGSSDNKGQLLYVLYALKLLLERDGKLPINVKLCIEGEEEVGSSGLSAILKDRKEELKSDFLAIVDAGIPNADTPAVTVGVRGIVTMDVKVVGATTDLHSGMVGGAAYNPIHALVEILSKARDDSGKVTIPGFYDDVADPSEEERKAISFDWFKQEDFEKAFGMKSDGGEKGYSPGERVSIRPTLEVNGIIGGYTGAGFKTVIPAEASAKVSCRLVPKQDPIKTGRLVKEFIEKAAPKGVKVTVDVHSGVGEALHADRSSKVIKAFTKAYEEVFQKPSQNILLGGSIPIIPELMAASQSEVAMVGVALSDDNIHAPNEHFGVNRLEQGCLIMARAMAHLGS